jgi:hypothetical protein
VAAGFDHQRRIDYRNSIRVPRFSFGQQTVLFFNHSRMYDLVQKATSSMIGEHNRTERLAIDGAIGSKNAFSEFLDDVSVSFTTRLHHRVGYPVSIKRYTSKFGKHRKHEAFADSDAPRESDL